jgi:hypothetical protein
MADEAVVGEDAAQVGMAGKDDAEHVVGLALEPIRARPKIGHRSHDRQIVIRREAAHPHALVVLHGQQVRHHCEAMLRPRGRRLALRLRSLLARHFAELETARSPALDATAEAFGRDVGVPFVAAIAEVVHATEIDQGFEAECIAQDFAAFVPGGRIEEDADFAAWLGHGDFRAGKTRAQALGEGRGRFAHQRSPVLLSPKLVARRIFFCNCRMP